MQRHGDRWMRKQVTRQALSLVRNLVEIQWGMTLKRSYVLATLLLTAAATSSAFSMSASLDRSTSFGRFSMSKWTTEEDTILRYRLLSWNILGPAYLSTRIQDDEKLAYLDWSHRSERIAAMLHESNADILCLQEIPTSNQQQQDQLLASLRDRYTVVLQNVTVGHPYGCATLVDHSKFRVVHAASRSRALWIRVEPVAQHSTAAATTTTNSSTITIANVHLMAGRNNEYTRWNQLRSLLQKCCGVTANNNVMTILAGDCNILPAHSPIHAWLTTGNWNETKAASPMYGIQPFHDVHEKVLGQVSRVARAPNGPWQYIDPSGFLDRTFTTGGILDSIWISSTLANARPWCIRVPPSKTTSWPSPEHPSDHWMVGMEFWFG